MLKRIDTMEQKNRKSAKQVPDSNATISSESEPKRKDSKSKERKKSAGRVRPEYPLVGVSSAEHDLFVTMMYRWLAKIDSLQSKVYRREVS